MQSFINFILVNFATVSEVSNRTWQSVAPNDTLLLGENGVRIDTPVTQARNDRHDHKVP